jgi:hypothetical protein
LTIALSFVGVNYCAKDRLEFKEQELEQRKRSRPEFGYFYKFVPREVVDPGFREEAEQASRSP